MNSRNTCSGTERATEGSGPKEHLHNSSRELKCTVCFCLSKHDSLSCFCYSEIKNIWLVCQAANAVDTPGHQHPSCHARESNQNSSDFRKSWLGFVFNTKLMDHPYTPWFIWILSMLKKKKKRQPTGTRNDYFKINMCMLVALPAASGECSCITVLRGPLALFTAVSH